MTEGSQELEQSTPLSRPTTCHAVALQNTATRSGLGLSREGHNQTPSLLLCWSWSAPAAKGKPPTTSW
jgi:hypothetical protein